MRQKIIWIRQDADYQGEEAVAARKAGFTVEYFRSNLSNTEGVGIKYIIPRYTVLPRAAEVYTDIQNLDCDVIQPLSSHLLLANASEWSKVLEGLTPSVTKMNSHIVQWESVPQDLRNSESFVLKGQTNSKKMKWKTHMFAKDKNEIQKIWENLSNDSEIYEQGIVIRPYIPLRQLGESVTGTPLVDEWRIFCYNGKAFCSGWYWTLEPDLKTEKDCPKEAINLAEIAADRLKTYQKECIFVAVDVARKQDGSWIVIEVNDGCQSGLQDCDPTEFYQNLMDVTI